MIYYYLVFYEEIEQVKKVYVYKKMVEVDKYEKIFDINEDYYFDLNLLPVGL